MLVTGWVFLSRGILGKDVGGGLFGTSLSITLQTLPLKLRLIIRD